MRTVPTEEGMVCIEALYTPDASKPRRLYPDNVLRKLLRGEDEVEEDNALGDPMAVVESAALKQALAYVKPALNVRFA